jgi:hypothetical protein
MKKGPVGPLLRDVAIDYFAITLTISSTLFE